jgi:hypothetical protein
LAFVKRKIWGSHYEEAFQIGDPYSAKYNGVRSAEVIYCRDESPVFFAPRPSGYAEDDERTSFFFGRLESPVLV